MSFGLKSEAMTTHEFFKRFPDEATCIQHMKKQREKAGIRCRSCDSSRLSWLSTCNRWECMDCKAKTTIRSGNLMMVSKLPIHTWYTCMFLMTSTPKAVSAKDMQQRLGMKRYEPVWYMMQKIRRAMGRANEAVQLSGPRHFSGVELSLSADIDNDTLHNNENTTMQSSRKRLLSSPMPGAMSGRWQLNWGLAPT